MELETTGRHRGQSRRLIAAGLTGRLQYFTGESFFQHRLVHERSSLTHWRQRLGERLEILLAESLRVAHDSGALKKSDLARITVDTTVQPKNVTHPTDAKLLLTAITKLAEQAKELGVPLRQSYVRVAKRAAVMAGRYAHAKQFNRRNRMLKFLRTRLGRLGRNFLKGILGDKVNAILAAVGHNFRHLLRWLRLILRLIIHRLRGALVRTAVTEHPPQALLLAS